MLLKSRSTDYAFFKEHTEGEKKFELELVVSILSPVIASKPDAGVDAIANSKRDSVPTAPRLEQVLRGCAFVEFCIHTSIIFVILYLIGKRFPRDVATMSVMLTKFESKSNRVKGITL